MNVKEACINKHLNVFSHDSIPFLQKSLHSMWYSSNESDDAIIELFNNQKTHWWITKLGLNKTGSKLCSSQRVEDYEHIVIATFIQLIETEWRMNASVNLPSSVQMRACRPFIVKPISAPMMKYCSFDPKEQNSVKY